jgi:hypothetical protein
VKYRIKKQQNEKEGRRRQIEFQEETKAEEMTSARSEETQIKGERIQGKKEITNVIKDVYIKLNKKSRRKVKRI